MSEQTLIADDVTAVTVTTTGAAAVVTLDGVTVQLAPELDAITVAVGHVEQATVATGAPQVVIDTAGGAPGPPGPPGSLENTITLPAAGPLGGDRLVVSRAGVVEYADARDATQAGLALLLTLAATAGDPVQCLVLGTHTEPTWSFPTGSLFVGHDGQLTAAPYQAGDAYVRYAGAAYAPDSIVFDPQPAIGIGA